MIYLTQLIYVREGHETAFHQFEDTALGLLAKYHGDLFLRLRPGRDAKIAGSSEMPYEVQIVRFDSENDLVRYSADEERQRMLPLKEESPAPRPSRHRCLL
jgi:hypothetical protein